METGVFPSQLKLAKVIPVHKKGNKNDITNYRPISILSCFSKIFETVIKSRLNKFLSAHNLISSSQHGFQKNKCTETALFDFVSNISATLNNRKPVIGLFIDLSKAFDTLDHKLLLHKLYNYGVRGVAHKWVSSYLKDRRQLVQITRVEDGEIREFRSTSLPISRGVPQGSILGPILFSVYINDMVDYLKPAQCVLYADDVNIMITGNTEEELHVNTETTTKKLLTWINYNKLVLNTRKTTAIKFHFPGQKVLHTKLSVDLNEISYSQTIKLLGVSLNENLSWNDHVEKLNNKLSSLCFAFYRLQGCVTRETLISLYHAKIQSILQYGVILWGNSSLCKSTFRIQKKVLRIIFKLPRNTSCREVFKNWNILTLPSLYIFKSIIFMIHNKSKFKTNSTVHKYCTRQINNIHIEQQNFAHFHNSVYMTISRLYNKVSTMYRVGEKSPYPCNCLVSNVIYTMLLTY